MRDATELGILSLIHCEPALPKQFRPKFHGIRASIVNVFPVYSTDARCYYGFHPRSINFYWVGRAVEVDSSSETSCLTQRQAQNNTQQWATVHFAGRLDSSLCTARATCCVGGPNRCRPRSKWLQ